MKLFLDRIQCLKSFFVFYLGFALLMAYHYIFPSPKIKDYFHNEKDFLKYKDEFIEYHKEKIVEIRDTRIINIKEFICR